MSVAHNRFRHSESSSAPVSLKDAKTWTNHNVLTNSPADSDDVFLGCSYGTPAQVMRPVKPFISEF